MRAATAISAADAVAKSGALSASAKPAELAATPPLPEMAIASMTRAICIHMTAVPSANGNSVASSGIGDWVRERRKPKVTSGQKKKKKISRRSESE